MIHFVKNIRIQNLLSFGPDSPELELKPINIIIGPNGSGKSNLLAALSLCVDRNTRTAEINGQYKNWFWNHDFQTPASIAIKTAAKNRYKLTLTCNGEVFEYSRSGTDFGDKIFLFRSWQFGPFAPIRQPQSADHSNRRLASDACNLGLVLKRIKSNKRNAAVFLGFLRELYENAEDIAFQNAAGYTFFTIVENGRKVPATRISDGTLRYLALLAVLCDPDPPNLICLEEPEMGLHPDLIQVAAKAIRYASERAQIIATTHSVALVDKFTDSPENIVVCEKIDGSTVLARLDPDEIAPWLEKYRLGDLWVSGQIGGNRW